MGYDLNRFKVPVNPGLICFLCKHVPEDPIGVKCCQTLFCHKCLTEWLQTNNTCPDDSINELDICCAFAANGCQVVVKVRDIRDHEKSCPYSRREKEETEKSLREEVKEVKEENKLITEILKKQINAINEMRTEMMRMSKEIERQEDETKTEMSQMKEKVGNLTQDKDLLKAEADLLKRQLLEYQRKSENEKDAKKRGPEAPLFLASEKHENLVIRLKREGVIKSDTVFNAMKAIDGRKECATLLETWGLRLREGFHILVTNLWRNLYVFPCLAEMVGEKGSVVGLISSQQQRKKIEKDHNYFLTSKRLTLEVMNFTECIKGAPLLSPFHIIYVFVPVISTSKIEVLGNQLHSGGKIIDADSGEVLFRKAGFTRYFI